MKSPSYALALAILISIVDGVLKYTFIQQPSLEKEGCFSTILCLEPHFNHGIAFSIPLPMMLILILSLVIIGTLGYAMVYFWKQEPRITACFSFVLAGALNNFFDRLFNQFTTDYIRILHFWTINLSDILILSGLVCLLWYSKRTDK